MCDPIRHQHTLNDSAGKEYQSIINMFNDNEEGDPMDPLNPNNIIHPTIINQFTEELRKLVERNTANIQSRSCKLLDGSANESPMFCFGN